MTKPRLLGAAAAIVLSSALAGPVMAQPVVTNPGKCAQYYPDANCQNFGPGNPYNDGFQNYGPGNSYNNAYNDGYQPRAAYRQKRSSRNNDYASNDNGWNNNGWNNNGWNNNWNNNGWNNRDTGFWPGDVAAGAVGTAGAIANNAVGTASAIAAAPFGGGPYAYYNSGYNNGYYNQSYAQRNGLVCTPGTWFKGEDGRRHPCQ
jgi:hypothetical protein